ncbi:hypothetical protein [Candidatus Kuenenia sp.]|uniref:hypothetical protein n=1 Tax=Candidatus Kuenenia sp. TaxID=2499824 RepID=UPI00321F8E66
MSKGITGITVKKHKTEKGYFSIHWLFNTRSIIFGLESGSNSMRWRSIVREAKRYTRSQTGLTAVMVRTFELPKIPKPTWKIIGSEIEEAKKEFFNIVDLKKDMVINIYAANELYRDAVEGDIPYSRDEVLSFIRKRFTWFWDTIIGDLSAGIEKEKKDEDNISPAERVVDEITAHIKKEKVLSLDELLMNLSKSLDKEKILDICTKTPQIKVYQSPRMTILQWQSNR